MFERDVRQPIGPLVVLRPTWANSVAPLPGAVVATILAWTQFGRGPLAWTVAVAAWLVALCGVFYLRTIALEVHAEELVVVNWRERRIARADVERFEMGLLLGTPRGYVVERGGRRTVLRALDRRVGPNDLQRFVRDMDTLEEWRVRD